MSLRARASRHTTAVAVGALALLAYLPALASSPGRMPADTKLYLYLDPAGLVGRAASTFEPDQFAGWVPFQQITYLWPSGPWYLLFDAIGAPDWIAHRLWIATIMFVAGTGVFWTARLLGLSRSGAFIAALVYQATPFVLAYISRTSLLLLPWAGLGWIVGLTVRATLGHVPTGGGIRNRLARWRDPALIALVVATVGSTNATTLAMIVPAPVLWIVHVAWQRRIAWRAALAVAGRIGVLCLSVSVWWVSMLYVQSRSGAPVLAYTETLADVSRNATGSEVLRGLGYWLFYQRDPVAATTTASLDHLVSLRTIALGYGVVVVGLLGLALTSWQHRRFAAMCAGAGVVLAVGVHPIDDPSPLMSLLLGDDEAGLALALRSSTRAVPLLLLGVGLGAGGLISAARSRLRLPAPRQHLVGLAATGLLAAVIVASLPALWNRALVDPAIDRDQDPPAAWQEASTHLDTTDRTARVLQLPGAEFGAFRWGYTTDHPLVALTDKPVVTRDLLPLGSPGAMDLLFALDDRVQDLTLDPDAVAPVGRLLGADTVWLSNDAAFERFRTTRPELLDELLTDSQPEGLAVPLRFGDPVVNVPEVDMIDPAALVEPRIGTPNAPVALIAVEDPTGVVRAKTESVVVSGSGDGIIDAAEAGLLSGYELIRSSGDTDDLAGALAEARAMIVTDTNRDQARHWRGSQDTRGHTEPGGPGDDVLTSTSADQRLAVFDDDAALQTVAVQDGPVQAVASSYGEPFAYRPEDRAVRAIDGDPATSWSVGDHGDPIGERIRLTITGADSSTEMLRLVQAPTPSGGRSISTVRITVDDEPPVDVSVDDSSFAGGQEVRIPTASTASTIDVEIIGVAPGEAPLAAALAGVGFAELDLGLGPTTEWIRPPVDAIDAIDGLAPADAPPLALLFTRLRVDPTDPWRSDPEPHVLRRFELPSPRTMDASATIRLDRRAGDADLAALLGSASGAAVPIASGRVTGGAAQRGAAAVDGDPTTAWMTPFDGAVGATLRFDELGSLGGSLVIDQPTELSSPITALRFERDGPEPAAVETTVPPPDAQGRSVVDLPAGVADADGPLTITITAIEPVTTVDRRYGDPRTLPAAITELTGTDGIDAVRIEDDVVVSAACDDGGSGLGSVLTIDGSDIAFSFTTTAGALLAGEAFTARACEPIVLGSGSHDLASTPGDATGLSIDRVVLADTGFPAPASADSMIGVEVLRNDPRARDVEVEPCPTGCWIVFGEGYNTEWDATLDGDSLGPPSSVDGGFNGWLLPPSADPRAVAFRWTAQTPVTIGLFVSALAALLCLLIASIAVRPVCDRARSPRLSRISGAPSSQRMRVSALVLVATSALLISPIWGVVSLLPAAVVLAASTRRRAPGRLLELTGVLCAVIVAVSVLWIVRNDRPFPNAGWTLSVDQLNGVAVFAIVSIAVGAMFAQDAASEPS